MENRELWLNSLSDDEVQNINPWDILTQPKAEQFIISIGRGILRKNSRFGLGRITNLELLHEVYPTLCEALPGILAACVTKTAKENRDRYIFGSLGNLIRLRLNEMVFGTNSPSARLYLEEVPQLVSLFSGNGFDDTFPAAHNLMHPYEDQVNAYVESHSSHEPQFLSDAELIPDQDIQNRHLLIERFRPYLTIRENEVLRCLLLQCEDRSMVALEIGSSPKQVSRYRQSIQKKLAKVLVQLGWEESEIAELVRKRITTLTA